LASLGAIDRQGRSVALVAAIVVFGDEGGSWCEGNLVGESGRSQITFDEQKLQLRHNDLLIKIQLFVITF
jgi:hypothetical protein